MVNIKTKSQHKSKKPFTILSRWFQNNNGQIVLYIYIKHIW